MDLADDVAYSVHDVEDGVVAGRVDLTRLDTAALWQTVREWYVPDADEHRLDEVLAGLRAIGSWPSAPYDGSRASMAALKNLTSDLIGRFCGAVQEATFAAGSGPFVRYAADLVVPDQTMLEIAVLKGVAAHYVMRADGRVPLMERQRTLIAELVSAVAERGPDALERPFADDWRDAGDDAARRRVVVDQVASLTDASAVTWHTRLVRAMSEPLVWLPFDPADLGDVPGGLRYAVAAPGGPEPAGIDEVEVYVPPYLFPDVDATLFGRMPRLRVVQTLTAGIEHIAPHLPDGRGAVQRARHPRRVDRRARRHADPGVAARDPRVRDRPATPRVGLGVATGVGRQAGADPGLRPDRCRDRGSADALRVRGGAGRPEPARGGASRLGPRHAAARRRTSSW